MGQAAVYPARISLLVCRSAAASLLGRLAKLKASREAIVLGVVLVVVQVCDGVLTGIGVHHYGIEQEANPLLRSLMYQFGFIAVLTGVKLFSAAVTVALVALSGIIPWVIAAMRTVVVIYVAAALIPWSAILIEHL